MTYRVEYRATEDTNWIDAGATTETSKALAGLTPGQSYDVRVTPHDGREDGPSRSAIGLFQTLAAGTVLLKDGFESN